MKDLDLINRFARKPIKKRDVYTFTVCLCDNEVDRDYERLHESTIIKLAELLDGVAGILNHDYDYGAPTARLYKTEVVTEVGTKGSDPDKTYMWLKGYAYMVRTKSNADAIKEIDGGIKKEVSIAFSAKKQVCCICGNEYGKYGCGHKKGETYGDVVCHAVIMDAYDAYEWSFVPVPAQRKARIIEEA